MKQARRVPEFFFTSVRKVEAVGSECVRMYCCVERNGVREDEFTAVMPIANVLATSPLVVKAALEIQNEAALVSH